jgi:hypothetical protein
MHDLVIIENMQDKILAIDFICNTPLATTHCLPNASGKLHLSTVDNCKLKKKIFNDALCSCKIKLKCVNYDSQKIGLSNTMIATISIPHSPITSLPGLIKFDKDGFAYAVVKNCSPYSIGIKRNDPMGFAEHHTEENNSEKLNTNFLYHLLKEVNVNSTYQGKQNDEPMKLIQMSTFHKPTNTQILQHC